MNQQLPGSAFAKVDKATFYAFAEENEGRFEYEDGYVVEQMDGGTKKHFRLCARFLRALEDRLDPTDWIVLAGHAVDLPEAVRFPDVVVEPAVTPDESLFTAKPALIVEVLSPSSVTRDLARKAEEYCAVPTLAAYVVASQDEAACKVWVRDETGRMPGEPEARVGLDATIRVPALALELPLADIYTGIVDANGS
ncbi:MAG: Uma2 family endonuclease [Pseudomonadota bacterium]